MIVESRKQERAREWVGKWWWWWSNRFCTNNNIKSTWNKNATLAPFPNFLLFLFTFSTSSSVIIINGKNNNASSNSPPSKPVRVEHFPRFFSNSTFNLCDKETPQRKGKQHSNFHPKNLNLINIANRYSMVSDLCWQPRRIRFSSEIILRGWNR